MAFVVLRSDLRRGSFNDIDKVVNKLFKSVKRHGTGRGIALGDNLTSWQRSMKIRLSQVSDNAEVVNNLLESVLRDGAGRRLCVNGSTSSLCTTHGAYATLVVLC